MPNFTIHTDTNTSQQFESASLSNETSEAATLEVAKRDGAGRILELATSLGDTLRSFDEAGRLASQRTEAIAAVAIGDHILIAISISPALCIIGKCLQITPPSAYQANALEERISVIIFYEWFVKWHCKLLRERLCE